MKDYLERPAFVIALLAIAVGAVLSGCWNAPFNAVDDPMTLHQSFHTVGQLFTPKIGKPFLPLSDLSLRFDYLFAPQPMVQHMTDILQGKPILFDVNQSWAVHPRLMNGLYHLLASFFLWIFLRRIGAGAGVALFAAMVWAGHPMNCESVCWIAERKNVLAAMFGFGALAAWTIDAARWWRWPLVYAIYLLAMLSKPSSLSLVPVLLALEVVDPIRREFNFRDGRHWLRLLKRTWLLFIMAFTLMQIGRYVYSLEIVKDLGGSLASILMSDVWILARYILHMVYPVHLRFLYYIEPVTSPLDSRFWLSALFIAAVFGGIVYCTERSRRHLAVLGLFWFVSGLGPNLNLFTTTAPLQDRWAYLAMPGFLLALALAVHGIFLRRDAFKPWLQYAAPAAMFLLLIAAGVQSSLYASTEILISDTAAREPKAGYAQIVAAELCRNQHLSAVQNKNPKEAIYWGQRSLFYYSRAVAAPDTEYFKDLLEIRTRMAEMLFTMVQYEQARKVLEGWVPPPGRTMVATTARSRLDIEKTYHANDYAHALNLMADCSLQLSNAPGLDMPKRLEWCQRALDEVEKARPVHPDGQRGELIKARTLMQRSYLEFESGREADALKSFADAQEVLKAIPESSPISAEARALLARARPPKRKEPAPPSPPAPLLIPPDEKK